MNTFSTLEFDVMDEVYFVSSFRQIMENTGASTEDVSIALLSLLQRDFIQQLIYNDTLNDYEKLDKYDESLLQTSAFVATKKGLLAHNSSN